jgi:hypothetical protein
MLSTFKQAVEKVEILCDELASLMDVPRCLLYKRYREAGFVREIRSKMLDGNDVAPLAAVFTVVDDRDSIMEHDGLVYDIPGLVGPNEGCCALAAASKEMLCVVVYAMDRANETLVRKYWRRPAGELHNHIRTAWRFRENYDFVYPHDRFGEVGARFHVRLYEPRVSQSSEKPLVINWC